MKKLLFLIALIFLFFRLSAQEQIFDDRTGIPVVFSAGADVFPESWLTEEINGKCEDLDTSEIRRSTEVVLRAMNKYPVNVLTENLKKTYVLKSINFYGLGYGGTNSDNVVYLANAGIEMGYTEVYMEQAFHHEFSGILLKNFERSFHKERWKACNGKGVVYGTSGVDALRAGKDSQEFNEQLNELGILNEYSLSDMGEDFSNYAENLFQPKPGFWELSEKYPAIRNKIGLVIAFYAELDPVFTEDYFRKFGE